MTFLWSWRIREIRSIMVIQHIESKIPRSRKRICGSSERGGFCVFSRIWASVVQAVHTLKFLITTQAKHNLSSRSGIGGVLSAT